MVTNDVNNLKRETISGSMRTLNSPEAIRMYLDNLMIKIEYESGKDHIYSHVFDELFFFIIICKWCIFFY